MRLGPEFIMCIGPSKPDSCLRSMHDSIFKPFNGVIYFSVIFFSTEDKET